MKGLDVAGSFSNRPKILRGAFVEYGLSIPPLFVVFQFNPVRLTRRRSQSFSVPGSAQQAERDLAQREGREPQWLSLRDYHQRYEDLADLRDAQQVAVQEESINFEIRLDATDKLDEGDAITGLFGIAPKLATLELMVYPKEESLLGAVGSSGGHSFSRAENPPMILFIWGLKRVLPVNINSINITETEFSTNLDPIRATASVSLTVIEGPNLPYTYSNVLRKVSAALNLANIADIANVVVPG